MRRVDPSVRLYSKHGQKRAWVNTQQTVIDEARQRVCLGQAWVFDQLTVSNRARQREIIQVHKNNPGGRKHNSKQDRQDYDYEN